MKKYKLTREMKTGIAEIDSQHEHLIELINYFNEHNLSSLTRENSFDVINELISYAHVHFSTEEDYLRKAKYPDVENHVSMHHELVKDLSNVFFTSNQEAMEKTGKYISDLLTRIVEDHLMKEDKKFAIYFAKK